MACVTQAADKFGGMSDAFIDRSSVRDEELVRDEVRIVVKEHMEEIKSLLQSRGN